MKKDKASILLVEDDENLGFILTDYLELQNYRVNWQKNGVDGYTAFKSDLFDICILDVMMPLKDGFTLAEDIRESNKDIPIVFLTAKEMKEDKIRGFKIGADDYITKPFSTEELSLRIEAILKRVGLQEIADSEKDAVFKLNSYTFDYTNQVLKKNGTEKRLTKKEAEVLKLLCQNANKLVRREIALKRIWGEDDYFMGRSMDVYITKLRKYLKDDPSITISNVHGTGFKLEIKQ